MHVALLGPLEIRHREMDVHLNGHHQRALVAALASEAGKVVSAERLIDTLWAERPPASARTKLQGYVSVARKIFHDLAHETSASGWPILTRNPGYLLCTEDVTVDLFEYRKLLQVAFHEIDAGEVAKASDHLGQAIELWRGTAFADASTPVLDRLADALERGRLLAIERKAECDLKLGRYDQVAEELTFVLAVHPLREGTRAALMLALYLRGCRAEALECYRAGRRILRDELGIDPGMPLRRLHEQMLCDSPSLIADMPRGPAVPETRLNRDTA